jgi:hypothetical protein
VQNMEEDRIKRMPKKVPKKIFETDLHHPVHQYFCELGYTVRSEVHHCDITATKGEELIIIELKKSLTMDLLVQAAKRQRITDLVYIAIPKPSYSLASRKWKDICHLVRRLELGLILITLKENASWIDIVIEPVPFDRHKSMQKNKKRREKIMSEIKNRHGDFNTGGSTRKKLMTAYKENAIQIACCLINYGPLTPKKLRDLGTGKKTQSILHMNVYGWFERVERGLYMISEKGRNEIQEYPELIGYFNHLLAKNE